ncbi:FAD-dependent thiol oxidase [Trametes coccinea BRFM310]|uniref:Sulfhydryl oxidase n=1 Tax=Trametes coccinea (strain BRFM310) TaxID=1353009 RepID=A0A1Y2IU89_TRAC3|nr:FAD-dependent thiol oxidase [Trametes coccinea BRFM310]
MATATEKPPSSSSSSNPSTKPALPPGMVIGPDGKPCKICTAFRNWKPRVDKPQQAQNGAQGVSGQQKTAAMMAAFASGTGFAANSQQQASTVTAPVPEPDPYARPENCPPDVEQLGRSTWTFLHTTAAYYPDKPTMAHRVNMLSLLRALPVLYPCSVCATHLGETMKTHPPDVSSRAALSRWLCEQHNEVNERLGKEKFDCSIEKLDERWKDGPADGSCD